MKSLGPCFTSARIPFHHSLGLVCPTACARSNQDTGRHYKLLWRDTLNTSLLADRSICYLQYVYCNDINERSMGFTYMCMSNIFKPVIIQYGGLLTLQYTVCPNACEDSCWMIQAFTVGIPVKLPYHKATVPV